MAARLLLKADAGIEMFLTGTWSREAPILKLFSDLKNTAICGAETKSQVCVYRSRFLKSENFFEIGQI